MVVMESAHKMKSMVWVFARLGKRRTVDHEEGGIYQSIGPGSL